MELEYTTLTHPLALFILISRHHSSFIHRFLICLPLSLISLMSFMCKIYFSSHPFSHLFLIHFSFISRTSFAVRKLASLFNVCPNNA